MNNTLFSNVHVTQTYEINITTLPHLTINRNINSFLQPGYNDMIDTASFIYAIEAERNDLKL